MSKKSVPIVVSGPLGLMSAPKPANPIEVTRLPLLEKSVNEAIREINSNSLPFVLFVNERTDQISVLYKRGKNSYGLVEVGE